MDAPVSNNACVCKFSICMLYSTWKPSMKTLLITDALGVASHAEELSESSNIIFWNSEIKLLNSSYSHPKQVWIFCWSAFYPEMFYKKFLLGFIWLGFLCGFIFWGGTLPGGCGAVLFVVFSLAMPTFGLVQSSWWLLCAFCSWLVGPVRGTRICRWHILNIKHWEWIPTWTFKVNGHICYILQDLGHGSPFLCFWFSQFIL